MRSPLLLAVAALCIIGIGCTQEPAATSRQTTSMPGTTSPTTTTQTEKLSQKIAFFYQYVGAFQNGVGQNGIKLGWSDDGETIESADLTALDWEINGTDKRTYGDPVFSRLSNGNWAMTSWSGKDDPRGGGLLLYHEATCPAVDYDAVKAIGVSTATGCQNVPSLIVGKTSQIFTNDGKNYLFHSSIGNIYLAQLSDAQQTTNDLESLCVLNTPAAALSEVDFGESTLIVNGEDNGLLLSDTAIAKRADGTWILFMKGISKDLMTPDQTCKQGSLCELCNRGIYRSTSTDLIRWSVPEKIVSQASVPEAYTTVDGTPWLYWQDFSDACEAQDLQKANIAPISGAYEMSGSYELSEPIQVSFPDESFETNKKMHYATNGNPVALPNDAAVEALEACVQ